MTLPAPQVGEAPLMRQTERSVSVVIGGDYSRRLAASWVDKAPAGCVITIEREPRTLQQSDKFWAICSTLAGSPLTWDGQQLDKVAWHDLLVHGWMVATKRNARLISGLEGGRVSLLLSTRRMHRHEMSELLDYAVAWATSHGVELGGEA